MLNKLVDTHCHMNLMLKKEHDILLSEAEIKDAKEIISQAQEKDVNIIINVGTSVIESINCVNLANNYNSLFAAVGVHPNDITKDWKADLEKITKLIIEDKTTGKNKIVAIGECGLDKHYEGYNLPMQIEAFKSQIDISLNYDLALIVHTRDAGKKTLEVLEQSKKWGIRGVIHCFSEDLSFAKQVIDMGFFLGIGGTITYPRNNDLRAIVEKVGLKHIILETDAPYLAPQVVRGKPNSPKYIYDIAYFIAQLLGKTVHEVAETTTKNAQEIFKFS